MGGVMMAATQIEIVSNLNKHYALSGSYRVVPAPKSAMYETGS
jgi:hypothetical protein